MAFEWLSTHQDAHVITTQQMLGESEDEEDDEDAAQASRAIQMKSILDSKLKCMR